MINIIFSVFCTYTCEVLVTLILFYHITLYVFALIIVIQLLCWKFVHWNFCSVLFYRTITLCRLLNVVIVTDNTVVLAYLRIFFLNHRPLFGKWSETTTNVPYVSRQEHSKLNI